MHKLLLALLLLSGISAAHAQSFQWNNERTPAAPAAASSSDPLADQTGLASVYADYYEGNPTALGEVFHQYEFTAAHAKLPLGSLVEVTRLDNGLSTTVRINDRGAFCEGCVIELSKAAAQQLGLDSGQQARVKLTVTGFRQSTPPASVAVKPTPSPAPAREPEFTTKGIPGPRPHAYQQYEHKSVPTAVPTPQHEQMTARTVSRTVAQRVATPAAESSGQVQIIDYLPAPYAVQLGSYNQFANAERHVHRLQEAGFTNIVVYKQAEVGHDPLYRVLILPFYTLSEAEDFADEVRTYHQMRAIILHNKLVEITVD